MDFTDQTVAYYDKASATYSKTRYEGPVESYVAFSFRARLAIGLSFVQSVQKDLLGKALLEIGCADGPVMRKIYSLYPGLFSKYVGIDISPEMIKKAAEVNTIPNATYCMVGEEPKIPYGLVLKLGVHSENTPEEMADIASRLEKGGYFIYSVTAPSSLYVKLKMPDRDYVQTYLSYSEYHQLFAPHFEIVKMTPCGFFIPMLWKVPAIARIIQPVAEKIARICPSLYHEQVYLLRKK